MRDQLWAEACAYEAAGMSIRLDPALYAEAAAEQEARRSKEPIEQMLTDAFGGLVGRVKIIDVWEVAGVDLASRKKPSNQESKEINITMARLGWEQPAGPLMFGDVKSRGFVRGTLEEREITLSIAQLTTGGYRVGVAVNGAPPSMFTN